MAAETEQLLSPDMKTDVPVVKPLKANVPKALDPQFDQYHIKHILSRSLAFKTILKKGDYFFRETDLIPDFVSIINENHNTTNGIMFEASAYLKDNFLIDVISQHVEEIKNLSTLMELFQKSKNMKYIIDSIYQNQAKILEEVKTNKDFEDLNIYCTRGGKPVNVTFHEYMLIYKQAMLQIIETPVIFVYHREQISEPNKNSRFEEFKKCLQNRIPNVKFVDLAELPSSNLNQYFNTVRLPPMFLLYDKDVYEKMKAYRGSAKTSITDDKSCKFIDIFTNVYKEFLKDLKNKRFYLFSFDDFSSPSEKFVYEWLLHKEQNSQAPENPFNINVNEQFIDLDTRVEEFLKKYYHNLTRPN